MAKSFEYRLLEPYREEEDFQDYDPVKVLDKVKEILIASQSGESADTEGDEHHVLSATGFQTLRSVLEEELSLLSDRIITGYESGDEREETFAYDALLREDELEELGESGSPVVLNLHKRRVYPVGEEAHRIADLRVTNSDFVMMIGDELVEADDPRLENLSSPTIDLLFEHSGLTRLSRKGQTYFFNHFRDGDPSKNPIRWTAKVNLFSGAVSMVRPSVASQSLLGTLLGTGNQLDVLNFSRPGANADIFLTTQNLNGGNGILPDDFRVRFTRIDLVAQLDYYQTSTDQVVDVRVTDPDGAALNIKPRILFDDADAPDQRIADEYGRRDSLGAISRSFPDVNRLKITAEAFYGSELAAGNVFPSGYRFVRWAGATSTTNEVIVTNDGVKRLLAIYERVGDVEAPEIEEFREVSTQGNLVTYEVTFSEDVVGVDVTDFVIGESAPGAGVRSVSKPETNRTRLVTIDTSLIAPGAATFRLRDDDSILDFTGNSLAGGGKGNGEVVAEIIGTGGGEALLSNFEVVSGVFQFELRGVANMQYQIESSTTLEGSWNFEKNVTTGAGGRVLVLTEGPVSGRMFYRAVAR